MSACLAAIWRKNAGKRFCKGHTVEPSIYTSESYLPALFSVQKYVVLLWRYWHREMHRNCIQCVSLPINAGPQITARTRRNTKTLFFLLIFYQCRIRYKFQRLLLALCYRGSEFLSFVVCFGYSNIFCFITLRRLEQKQWGSNCISIGSDMWKNIAVHDCFQALGLCSSDKSSIKMKMD